jgi:preprotein translocase subunit SecF
MGDEITKEKFSGVKKAYEQQYKKLLIIPFALLLIAIILIGAKYASTGEFVNRDVSLKGGTTITIPTATEIDLANLESVLSSRFPESDIATKSISQFGSQVGIIVEADIDQEQTDAFVQEIGTALNRDLAARDYTIEIVGSSLGSAFFKQLVIALLISFLLMALVVFIYFKSFVPSIAVILAAFSDIVVTLAVVNFLEIKLSAAGIAAFLMLIGYSVDTDILLSTRVLKRREGSVMDRVYGAFSTGITMALTTMVAVTAALLVSQSEVIRQIMLILLIGLIVDLVNTWIQNVGILRLYLEKKAKRQNELQA